MITGDSLNQLVAMYIVLLILGSLSISYGFLFTQGNLTESLVSIIIGLALFLWSYNIYCKDDKVEMPKNVSNTPQPLWQEAKSNVTAQEPIPQEKSANWADVEFNVAGVTFKNDNKSSRQTILKDLYRNGEMVEDEDNLVHAYPDNFEIEGYDFDGKQAFRLLCDGKCIGNVPIEYIKKVDEAIDRNPNASLFVGKFLNEEDKYTYYAKVKLRYKMDN